MLVCASLVTVMYLLLTSKFKKSIKYLQFLADGGLGHHGFTTVHHQVSHRKPIGRRMIARRKRFIKMYMSRILVIKR
jgi:hypothetical protein